MEILPLEYAKVSDDVYKALQVLEKDKDNMNAFQNLAQCYLLMKGHLSPDEVIEQSQKRASDKLHHELLQSTKNQEKLHRKDAEQFETVPVVVSHEFKTLLMQSRCKSGLSQAALAQKMNVKVHMIKNWENGVGTVPNTVQKRQLSKLLHIQLK